MVSILESLKFWGFILLSIRYQYIKSKNISNVFSFEKSRFGQICGSMYGEVKVNIIILYNIGQGE